MLCSAICGVVQQRYLAGIEPLARDGVFFAIFPDAATAVCIARVSALSSPIRAQWPTASRYRDFTSRQDPASMKECRRASLPKRAPRWQLSNATLRGHVRSRWKLFRQSGQSPVGFTGDDGVVGLTMLIDLWVWRCKRWAWRRWISRHMSRCFTMVGALMNNLSSPFAGLFANLFSCAV